MSKKISIYYTVCGPKKNAKSLAMKLIKSKKAICVNLIKNVESFYMEKNKIKKSNELILIIKTMNSKKDIYKFIKKYHSYKIPFITKIENKDVNGDYLFWAKSKINSIN